MERPKVILGRRASEGMMRGAGQLGHLLGLTLGPVAGNVVSAKDTGERYETITDGATMVRRIIALPEPVEDAGAMLLRQLVWRVRQKVGDGSATAGVLALGILNEARRSIAAGANAMQLRAGIEKGMAAATKALQEMSLPLEGQERMAALATAACGDPDLGRIVGEIYETIGTEGVVTVQDYIGFYLNREYIEGSRFKASFTSRYFLTDVNHRLVQLVHPYIFITDWNLSQVEQVAPLLRLIVQEGEKRPLLVVSASQDGAALSTLLANHQKGVVQCCGVTPKGVGDPMRAALEDMALITGGRFIYKGANINPADITLADLGQADRIEVSEDFLTIFQGAGDRKAVRQRRIALRAALEDAKNVEEAAEIRERLGRLSGGIAILKVGAPTDKERERIKQQGEEAVRVVAEGVRSGVVPGGGAAYLACIPAVEAVQAQGDEVFGVRCLARALEEPMRRIAMNSGLDPNTVVHRARERGQGFGVNVFTGEVVDMSQAGIMDSARVLQAALETAVSGANMLLTTGALILHRQPETSVEP